MENDSSGRAPCGVVYCVYGQKYVEEALRSARSVKCHNPDLPVCFVTPDEVDDPVVDHIVTRPDLDREHIIKVRMLEAPFKKLLFLDSDTTVDGDLSPLFELLDYFDIAARPLEKPFARLRKTKAPIALSELNSGVLALRRSAEAEDFLARWAELFADSQENARLRLREDQPLMRQALAESSLRFCPLSSVWNFQPWMPAVFADRIVIFHGRHPNLDRVRRLTRPNGMRQGYYPEVGSFSSMRQQSLSEFFRIQFGIWRRIPVRIGERLRHGIGIAASKERNDSD